MLECSLTNQRKLSIQKNKIKVFANTPLQYARQSTARMRLARYKGKCWVQLPISSRDKSSCALIGQCHAENQSCAMCECLWQVQYRTAVYRASKSTHLIIWHAGKPLSCINMKTTHLSAKWLPIWLCFYFLITGTFYFVITVFWRKP